MCSLDDIEKPIIRIYGVTQKGNSVLVHLHNYEPYFYAAIPASSSLIPSELPALMSKLNDIKRCVKKVEIVNKFPLMPYTNTKSRFLKITTNSPKNVTEMRGNMMIRCF